MIGGLLLEAVLEASHPFGTRPDKAHTAIAFGVSVVKAHVDESILVDGLENHIDPDKLSGDTTRTPDCLPRQYDSSR